MDNSKKAQIFQLLSMFGGVYYAHTKKSSIWGYMGYGFLFSVVGGIVGRKIFNVSVWTKTTSALPPASSTQPTNNSKKYIFDGKTNGLVEKKYLEVPDVAGLDTSIIDLPPFRTIFGTSNDKNKVIVFTGESVKLQPHSNPQLANQGYMEVSNSPNAKEYLKSDRKRGYISNGYKIEEFRWFPKEELRLEI
jgi:hypothetical protein